MTRLHVDVHPGDGPPALLVHGFLGGRALWAANVEALRAVCTPVTVELWGHGRSPSPTDAERYGSAAYAAAFDVIRIELGAERCFVIGHSLGAALTWRYALDHPDRVLGHVFSNTASALAGPSWRQRVEASVADEADRLEAAGSAVLADHRLNPARVRHIVEPVRDALAADQERLDARGVANTLRHTLPGSSARHRAVENRVPTLLVHGTKETAFAEAASFASDLPHVDIEPVAAGHSPNAEAPGTFNRIVVEFLDRLRS